MKIYIALVFSIYITIFGFIQSCSKIFHSKNDAPNFNMEIDL